MSTPETFARSSPMPPSGAVTAAVEAAKRSPCQKSKRGCSVFDVVSGEVIASAFNSRPDGKCDANCQGDPQGLRLPESTCSRLCVHAEARAIRHAISVLGGGTHGPLHAGAFDLVHAKITRWADLAEGGQVHDKLAISGHPSCWQCARDVLDEGLGGVWLFHAEGWRRYAADEFHRLTLDHCQLVRSP